MPDPIASDQVNLDPVRNLGVRVTPDGGELRVWSATATAMELCLFADKDLTWVSQRIPMARDENGVWSATSSALVTGAKYSVRASGPNRPSNAFNPELHLIDPYARGLTRTREGDWRSVVQDDRFDWGGVAKPNIPLHNTVIYEAHTKGLTTLNLDIPKELRGSYAGLAHDTTIAHLKDLGVTAVELLPVHQFTTEQRLVKQGLNNYWGYNTVNFFMPHAAYASRQAQVEGSAAILREFKGMVRLLHEAGLEVILDVVYNHTAEEGIESQTLSFRGIDNASYYRHRPDGSYIDVTGCGNTVNTATPAVQRFILDSLRYWATEVQIDGFRFDLAVALGRDASGNFDPMHPLLKAIVSDPELKTVKMIAEPWDVGPGGWQVGNFPDGWAEWNDGYRDRVRDFWLSDIAAARATGVAPIGIGQLASKLAGSSDKFPPERGPVASLNFVTAHDGFTMNDLVSFNQKHNVGNGENNQDGTDDNHSFNHGVEGSTMDPAIRASRRKAMRNLLGTLLLSAGVPMLTAGDEFGRSQRGNNNAYCHDSTLTWLPWQRKEWQQELRIVTQKLIRLRREHPALRPVNYGVSGETLLTASQMDWFDADGLSMSIEDWGSPQERTLQFLAASNPEAEDLNRILLIVHGLEDDTMVTLPQHQGVSSYALLWDSADDDAAELEHAPGTQLTVSSTSMQLLHAR
jgi:glycogen operon protein